MTDDKKQGFGVALALCVMRPMIALQWDGANDFADDHLILHANAHTQNAG